MSTEPEVELGADKDTTVPMLQTGERIDSGTLAEQVDVPLAETNETNPFGSLGAQSVRMNISRSDADHFFATVILYPNGLNRNEVPETHAYMLPSSLLEPYRAQINARIEEAGDYTAVAVISPSCRCESYQYCAFDSCLLHLALSHLLRII